MTGDEAEALVEKAANHLRPFIVTALHTGGRLGELLKLRWDSVSFPGEFIRFTKETTKGNKTRDIPMSPTLHRVLEEMGGRFKGKEGQDLVFKFRGKPLKCVKTAFAKARTDAGLGRDVRFHTLRHTFATWFLQNGGDLHRLQKYLGHSTSKLTERYSHHGKDYLQDGVAFIGAPKKSGGHSVDTPLRSERSAESPSA